MLRVPSLQHKHHVVLYIDIQRVPSLLVYGGLGTLSISIYIVQHDVYGVG
jgi:hypothetical protein